MATRKPQAQAIAQDTNTATLESSLDKLRALLEGGFIKNAEDHAAALENLARYEALNEKFGSVKSSILVVTLAALVGAAFGYAVQYVSVAAGIAMFTLTGSVVLGQLAYWATFIAGLWIVFKFGDSFFSVVLTIADWIATGYLWVRDQLSKAWNWITSFFRDEAQ